MKAGKTLADFPTMEQINVDDDVEQVFDLAEELDLGQRDYALIGPGGTGKTHVNKTIVHMLRGQKKKVCTMAFTGIAATLLPAGRTLHNRFGLTLDMTRTFWRRILNPEGGEMYLFEAQILWNRYIEVDTQIEIILSHLTIQEEERKISHRGAEEAAAGISDAIIKIFKNLHFLAITFFFGIQIQRVYGDVYMPDGLRSLFFEDNDGRLQLFPQLVASLINGFLYGQAASRKVCLLVRNDIEHNGLSGVDKLPIIPEMEDLYEDSCTCICALISFYRLDALPLRDICFKDPMSVHDCRFTLDFLHETSAQYQCVLGGSFPILRESFAGSARRF
ncbi:hypothetical protein niasHS_002230 [Heterodera schachtii]|uniref:ATP-dependent DNA helicase n=1 Tax=Heterodera schachtii TaxID=97005 RepID=A0ABD2KMW3_HETSC